MKYNVGLHNISIYTQTPDIAFEAERRESISEKQTLIHDPGRTMISGVNSGCDAP
jgi:hypothetical protein